MKKCVFNTIFASNIIYGFIYENYIIYENIQFTMFQNTCNMAKHFEKY